RQTLWGGAGKPPSRDVMAAAARAARREMTDRIRDSRAGQGQKKERSSEPQQAARRGNGAGNGNGRSRPQQQPKPRNGHQQQQPPRQQVAQRHDEGVEREDRDDDRMPSNIDPLRTNMPSRRDMTGVKRVNEGGQPDPTRTSIDSMGQGKRSGG